MIAATLALPLGVAVLLASVDGRRRWAQVVAAAGLVVTLLLLGAMALRLARAGPLEIVAGGWPIGLGIRLRVDWLGLAFASASVVSVLAALLCEASAGIRGRAAPALLLFVSFGLVGLCLTADAFNFYVFFEVAMTGAIALAGYGGAPREYRAAFIFAVVNTVGTAMFLAAVAALYHATGTLDMAAMAEAARTLDRGPMLPVAAVLFVAFGLKLGLFPFHFWLPAVYRDTSPVVAAVLSGAIANIGSYGLLRFGSILGGALAETGDVLAALGAASILYGSVLALSRPLVAEVLAYSSVAQAGYIMLAIGVAGPAGLAAAVVYALVNSLTKTLLFLAQDLSGPLVRLAFLVGALSVAGVPPTAGFFGKLSLFRAAATRLDGVLTLVLVAGSMLSVAYMAAASRRQLAAIGTPAPASGAAWTLVLLAGLVTLGGIWPQPLLTAGQRAAEAIQGMP